ncbi:MAG: PilZ domain-containing protein [Alphaproteobacteria bacterium]|nr:PilZ domain-containing protein [Alphaproteobacteria bacterium]
MKIQGSPPQPRHERFSFKERVEVTTPSGERFQTESQDVSRSGISLSVNAPFMQNGQFLELHAEGLGNVSGKVARTYIGGAAVQFDKLLEEQPAGGVMAGGLDRLA